MNNIKKMKQNYIIMSGAGGIMRWPVPDLARTRVRQRPTCPSAGWGGAGRSGPQGSGIFYHPYLDKEIF